MMNGWIELLDTIFKDITNYSLVAIFFIVLYFWIFRKHIFSVIDPFVLSLISSAMATSVVVYMFNNNLIEENEYFVNFIFTEVAYLIGLFVFSRKYLVEIHKNKIASEINYIDDRFFNNVLYIIVSIFYVISQSIGFILIGAPLFSADSRLSFYTGGAGFIPLIINSISPVLTILLIDRFVIGKKNILVRILDIGVLLFLLMSLILTGAKGAIMTNVSALYFYKLYIMRNNKNKYFVGKINNIVFILCIIAIGGALTIVGLKEAVSVELISILMQFGVRFIASGDIFAYFYSHNFESIIIADNPFLAIFGPILGLIRLIPYDELPKSLGLQIWQYYNNSLEVLGPNARHNIFGYVYFGFVGSIIYSFIIGMIFSFVRNRMIEKYSSRIVYIIIYTQLYFCTMGFNLEISLNINYLFSFLLIFTPIVFITYYIIKNFKLNRKI